MNRSQIDLFKHLVSLNATSGKERIVRDFLIKTLSQAGFSPYEDTSYGIHGGDCGNVICPVGNGGRLMLVCHMDTVRSTRNTRVIVDDDRLRSDGNTILGADSRASITILLCTLLELIKENEDLNFTLAFTVREELDSMGAIHMDIPAQIKEAVVFDLSDKPGAFVMQGFGAKKFKITVNGKASHAGLEPEKGISAIAIAGNAVSRIKWGRVSKDVTSNIGLIEGGSSRNVVPDECILEGEVRSIQDKKTDEFIKEIKQTFKEEASRLGGSIIFESKWDFRGYKHTKDSEIYRNVERVFHLAGLNPIPVTTASGSDANEFNARGIPTINIGIGLHKPHSKEEYILIEDMKTMHKVAEIFMRGEFW